MEKRRRSCRLCPKRTGVPARHRERPTAGLQRPGGRAQVLVGPRARDPGLLRPRGDPLQGRWFRSCRERKKFDRPRPPPAECCPGVASVAKPASPDQAGDTADGLVVGANAGRYCRSRASATPTRIRCGQQPRVGDPGVDFLVAAAQFTLEGKEGTGALARRSSRATKTARSRSCTRCRSGQAHKSGTRPLARSRCGESTVGHFGIVADRSSRS